MFIDITVNSIIQRSPTQVTSFSVLYFRCGDLEYIKGNRWGRSMEKSNVQILDIDLKVIKDINQYEQIGGVWAAFDSDGKCWNVAETKNIAKEMREDIIYMHFSYVADPSWEMVNNHFGKEMFQCPLNDLIPLFTWANVARACNGKDIYFVVFEVISNLKDTKENKEKNKEENFRRRAQRRKIEKYIAYKTRAVYWRDGVPFKRENNVAMEKAVEAFITSFENEKGNKKIISSLQTVMNLGFLKNSH